jgi:hypothetical protein
MPQKIDDELKQLAALALRNAFWRDFSAMVNAYLAASQGLDVVDQEAMIGELASVYGRDVHASGASAVFCWTTEPDKPLHHGTPHLTIAKALADNKANEIRIRGKKVFERRGGEWYYVGDSK